MAKRNVTATPTDPKNNLGLERGNKAVEFVQNPPKTGDADLPVQQPGAGAPVQTMSDINVSHTVDDVLSAAPTINDEVPPTTNDEALSAANDAAPTATSNSYTSLNEQINGDASKYYEYVEWLAKQLAQNPSATEKMTDEQLRALAEQYGINYDLFSQYSQTGGYTKDRDYAMANGGTGEAVDYNNEAGWYYYPGIDRPVAPGTSGADERFTSDGSYTLIQALQADWFKFNELAKAAEEAGDSAKAAEYYRQRDMCNVYANQIRGLSDYSGGTDGSMYVPLAQLGIEQATQDILSQQSGTTGRGGTTGADSAADTPEAMIQALLDEWKATALEQSNGQIDYAVAQAIRELERALEDAQPQFKEQAESVSIDERNAMDNAALYAELRGDRGGIGQEQYSSIQNTAAQNRLAVQQAQTKLATDTARQIEDLRAQGEFEKADKALEITQNYLAQLVSLEQWAAEFNLTQEQFQASLQQWEAEYLMALQQMGIAQNQWQQEFDYAKDSTLQNQLAAMGEALLSAGIMPDAKQLVAMGLSEEQAKEFLEVLRASEQLSASSGGTGEVTERMSKEDVYNYLYGIYGGELSSDEDDIKLTLQTLAEAGLIDKSLIDTYAAAYMNTGYEWAKQYAAANDPINDFDMNSVNMLGLSTLKMADGSEYPITADLLDTMINAGILIGTKTAEGKIHVTWAPGWNLQQFINGWPAYAPEYGGQGGMTLGDPFEAILYEMNQAGGYEVPPQHRHWNAEDWKGFGSAGNGYLKKNYE